MGENSASAQINLCIIGLKLNRAAYSTPLCFNRVKGYYQYILIHISESLIYISILHSYSGIRKFQL